MSGSLTFNQRLEAERELLRQLDLQQLEQLAAESQALIDRALAGVRARMGASDVIDVPVPRRTPKVADTSPLMTGAESAAQTPHIRLLAADREKLEEG